jgi:hypothetical protein
MNNDCAKKTAHSQNILHGDNIKRKNTKRFVQNWHLPKSTSTEWS